MRCTAIIFGRITHHGEEKPARLAPAINGFALSKITSFSRTEIMTMFAGLTTERLWNIDHIILDRKIAMYEVVVLTVSVKHGPSSTVMSWSFISSVSHVNVIFAGMTEYQRLHSSFCSTFIHGVYFLREQTMIH